MTINTPRMRYRYIAYILLILPVFLLRDYTPAHELKYLSIVDEALRNGTWFTFYNHGDIYADKPPLYFWLIMLSKLFTGNYQMWAIGLLSLLPSVGILAVMDNWLQKEEKTFNPAVANGMLLTTAMYLGATLYARMDMLMTFFIVLSLHSFYSLYKKGQTGIQSYLLPVYIFLAVFTKGPVGLLIPVLSIIAFLIVKKESRNIGRYLGWRQILIFTGLCAAWFIFVYIEGGKTYLNDMIFTQTIGRGIDSFHHKEPFWFYFPRMLWSFAPWSLLCIALIGQGIYNRRFSGDLEKFFLTVITTSILLLSVVSSKIDIYLLPVYPFVIYLCCVLLPESIHQRSIKMAVYLPSIACILLLPAAIILKDRLPDLSDYSVFAFTGIAVTTIGGIAAIILLHKEHISKAVFALSSGIIGLVFVGSFTMPAVNRYIGFGEMAKTTQITARYNKDIRYAFYKFDRASNMNVYLNRDLQQINSVTQLDSLAKSGQETILFVRNREIQRDEIFARWIARHSSSWSFGDYSWYLLNGNGTWTKSSFQSTTKRKN